MSSNVDPLLAIGQPDDYVPWPDYPGLYKLDETDIPALINILTDTDINKARPNNKKPWAQLHAWRALGQLQAADAVPVIMGKLEDWDDSPWAVGEIPAVLGLIGEPAIAPAHAVFVSSRYSEAVRTMAMWALVRIGSENPSCKDQVYPLLSRYALQPDLSAKELNAMLVNDLAELDGESFHDEIIQLLQSDAVDLELVDPQGLAAVFDPADDEERVYPEGENPDPLDILDYYLDHYGNEDSIVNVSELEGYFAALACSPDVIMPSQWLPLIWGGEDKMPDWEEQKEISEFHELLMEFHNEVIDHLLEGTFSPLFYESEFQGRNVLLVDDWCRGFLLGTSLYGPLSEQDRAEIDRRVAPIRMFDIPANLEKLAQLDMDELTDLQDSIEPNVIALYQFFMGRRVAEAHTPYMNTAPSVGRNDPCPCGSGKKFKKCCLH